MNDDVLDRLLAYATRLGIRMQGITPRRLPGRGYGMVATRNVQEGETVLAVPARALRTRATLPAALREKLEGSVSVHGMLAAQLTLDGVHEAGEDEDEAQGGAEDEGEGDGDGAAWNAVLPTTADLEAGMPLLWPTALQALLPTAAATALARQKEKLRRDWEGVRAAAVGGSGGSRLTWRRYAYAWLLVNSRTFYYEDAVTRRARKSAAAAKRDDCLAMQPVADLFNHAADRGCRTSSNQRAPGIDASAGSAAATFAFVFVADTAYAAGDEVPISYGAHGNDALLVEYGFVLPGTTNRWDEVALDAVLQPRLDAVPGAAADLDAAGFLGRYVVDADTPAGCFRTQVALRRLLCGAPPSSRRLAAWHLFVHTGGEDDDPATAAAVEALVLACLGDMAERAHATLDELARLGGDSDGDGDEKCPTGRPSLGTAQQCRLLAQRWQQIEAMVARAAETLRAGTSVEAAT